MKPCKWVETIIIDHNDIVVTFTFSFPTKNNNVLVGFIIHAHIARRGMNVFNHKDILYITSWWIAFRSACIELVPAFHYYFSFDITT